MITEALAEGIVTIMAVETDQQDLHATIDCSSEAE